MKISFLVILIAMISACTPRQVYAPQEVKIPVAASCNVKLPEDPKWEVPDAINATYTEKVKAMAKDLNNAHAYIDIVKAGAEVK